MLNEKLKIGKIQTFFDTDGRGNEKKKNTNDSNFAIYSAIFSSEKFSFFYSKIV